MLNDPRRDPELASLLRTASEPRPPRDAGGRRIRASDTARLTRRITAAAGYALIRRRYPAVPAIEYIATWSRRLLPLGVVCTFAGGVLLSQSDVAPRPVSADEAVIGAATNRLSTPEIVEMMLQSEDAQQVASPLQSHE
jgi:hypothetical protein